MKKKVVSIIIPIYNGENYIFDIFQNIKEQTYRPLEIIFVNDGSWDNSQIAIEHVAKEQGMKEEMSIYYWFQQNKGIANARNFGLEKASGEYVMFMDQDDWMEPDCIEVLINEAVMSNAELVIGGVNKVDGAGTIIDRWHLNDQLSWSKFRITAPWGRIFKKSLIDENGLAFFDTKISEDLYFNILFMSYAKQVKVISYIGYNWLQNKKSESHENWSKLSDERNPLPMLIELHKKMGGGCLIKKEEMTFFFSKYLVWYLLFSSRQAEYRKVAERAGEVFVWLQENYPDYSRYVWKSMTAPKGEQLKVRLCVALVLFMKQIKVLPFFLWIYSRL